ncbi:MAG: site-specific DNA-methyltransferase [Acidobacteriota bacterium]
MNNWAKIIIGDSRSMKEVESENVDLIITSPPYWHIKDYGIPGQIGYGQSLHEYLRDLYYAWTECFRILRKGGRLCLNIGDQFARSIIYGRYKVIPLHAEFIAQCEKMGFDFMGSIIWQKKTTMNTTGGANVMGSFPYPPNGIVEIDYEFIHIFKKPGQSKKVSKDIKEASKLTKEEWKEYFAGHWHFGGARQIGHEAMFPDELPRRLIKMFTYIGDTVLDPFLGSGTTAEVALELERNAIGYEINEEIAEIIKKKIGLNENEPRFFENIQIIKRKEAAELPRIDYIPGIQDAKPKIDPKKINFKGDRSYKVIDIVNENAIKLDTGLIVKFLGLKIDKRNATNDYLQDYILGKNVYLRFQEDKVADENAVMAYVYLNNKIFINAYLIKSGFCSPDFSINHKLKDRFIELWKERQENA